MPQTRKKYEGFALEMDVAKKISHQLARLPDAARERVYSFAVGALKRGEDFSKLERMSPESQAAKEVDGQTHLSDLA